MTNSERNLKIKQTKDKIIAFQASLEGYIAEFIHEDLLAEINIIISRLDRSKKKTSEKEIILNALCVASCLCRISTAKRKLERMGVFIDIEDEEDEDL